MRFLIPALLLLLGACAGQERSYYDRDPWADYDPYDRKPTYDEGYVLDADRLVARAKKAESRGRDDEARVDYHQAFRRDRWHPAANDGYQDLMLREGLFDKLWQEYLDLWQQNPERGDALWYHLRPMLIERGDQPLQAERRPKLDNEGRSQIAALLLEVETQAPRSADKETLRALHSAMEIANLPEFHIRRIELANDDFLAALKPEYDEWLEDNPASGNALALHSLLVARQDPHAAMSALRDAWILEYPGVWLSYAVATLCLNLTDDSVEDEAAVRSALGWLHLAEAFGSSFNANRPEDALLTFDTDAVAAKRKSLKQSPASGS